jgi:hypothetical protein
MEELLSDGLFELAAFFFKLLQYFSMRRDPLYEEVSPRLRHMTTSELTVEERVAHEALTQLVLKYMDHPNYEDLETVSAEARLLEAQLALNLKVRDETVTSELVREIKRTGAPVTPQVQEMMRSLTNGAFGREIDRVHAQLTMCRQKLATWR